MKVCSEKNGLSKWFNSLFTTRKDSPWMRTLLLFTVWVTDWSKAPVYTEWDWITALKSFSQVSPHNTLYIWVTFTYEQYYKKRLWLQGGTDYCWVYLEKHYCDKGFLTASTYCLVDKSSSLFLEHGCTNDESLSLGKCNQKLPYGALEVKCHRVSQ